MSIATVGAKSRDIVTLYFVCILPVLLLLLLLLCGVLSTLPLPLITHGIDGRMVWKWCMGKDLGISGRGLKGGPFPMVA
jgi:hypothetical protein